MCALNNCGCSRILSAVTGEVTQLRLKINRSYEIMWVHAGGTKGEQLEKGKAICSLKGYLGLPKNRNNLSQSGKKVKLARDKIYIYYYFKLVLFLLKLISDQGGNQAVIAKKGLMLFPRFGMLTSGPSTF